MEETIGVLALEAAQSLGALAHGFSDNEASVLVGTDPTPLASVTVTPQRTGKFQVSGTAIAVSGVSATFSLAVGHASIVDYSQSVGLAASGQSSTIMMQYGSARVPLKFPVGSPVTLVLFGQASVAGTVFIRASEAQITVLELPN